LSGIVRRHHPGRKSMQVISFSEPRHIMPRVPAPATYLIVPDGKIVFASINAEYTERIEPGAVIRALKDLVA